MRCRVSLFGRPPCFGTALSESYSKNERRAKARRRVESPALRFCHLEFGEARINASGLHQFFVGSLFY